LCKLKIKTVDKARAALSGLFAAAGSLRIGRVPALVFSTENPVVARWTMALIQSFYPQLQIEMEMVERSRLGRSRQFSLHIFAEALFDVLSEWGILKKSAGTFCLQNSVPWHLIAQEENARCYLRGVFLGAGTMIDPEKGYQLEFVLQNEAMAKSLGELLLRYDIQAKSTIRKASYVVYLKESDKIAAFLGRIGASGAVLQLEEKRVYKELRNHLNRRVNCETGNIEKTANASARQIENIHYLSEKGVLYVLSDELREMAALRIQHPDATLAELGEFFSPAIGKSGVNHRLRKLNEIADQNRKQKEETGYAP